MTGNARTADLTRAALATLRESIEREAAEAAGGPAGRPAAPSEPPYIALMQGPGGILYVRALLATLWRDPALLAEAAPEIELIEAQLAEDRELDVVAGAAGASAGCWPRTGFGPRALAVAALCGEHLLARAEARGAGICWPTRLAPERSQTGFAHGVTGIALALVALGAAAGDRRFTEAGLAAFAWEREVF